MPEEAVATPPPQSIVNTDGTLVENWHTLAPEGYEELRNSETLPRFKKFWDLGKSYENVRRQVPLDKIAMPNDNFTDEDWNQWYQAGGRPETAEDYNIQRPDDFPEQFWDVDRTKGFQKLFHEIGLSKKQAEKLVEYNNKEVLEHLKAQEQREEQDFNAIQDKLHSEWGSAYDQKVHIGNTAIEKGCENVKDPDFKERVLEKVNKDPDLIRLCSNLGSKFVESRIIETPQIPTPGDIQSQIDKAVADPSYLSEKHPNHKRQVELVHKLFEEKERLSKKVS